MNAARNIPVPLAQRMRPANLDEGIGQRPLLGDETHRFNKAVKHFIDQLLSKLMVRILEMSPVPAGRNHV
ncbi:hypothetical protein LPB67_07925 [Undibacterium sp. Jales W-56]|uniref:hypothetical protein n=1 Tax=Undibacterium sp. Jales W-56 TaxID=2897325 RepID=UPI0021D1D0D3|nr:hypothetical protein [Undibacterium sp. Jales W-56]MCU6433704.1 hypothetical protein [Undibacterium sp. Jales W-56]